MKALRSLLAPALLAAAAAALYSCSDSDSYAERRERERAQISSFLQSGIQIQANDESYYLLNIPGNIQVISEAEFAANDSTTDVERNEYVFFENSGVYMQIVRKGTGKKIEEGETATVLCRYTEYNIASDSIQSSNRTLYYATQPDVMSVQNNYGTFTATFTSGVMLSRYSSSAVPSGWLVPLSYINLGRQDSDSEGIALVRIIVPSTQGQNDAAYEVYPCFYELTYQRGR